MPGMDRTGPRGQGPLTGRGFGWRRDKEKFGKGKTKPGGVCVCEKCGYKIEHERGVPCSSIKCPKCKVNLKRELK